MQTVIEYADNMHLRTLRKRCVSSIAATRRSRWTDQGCDPRNTARHWYWLAVGALNYRLPVQRQA